MTVVALLDGGAMLVGLAETVKDRYLRR